MPVVRIKADGAAVTVSDSQVDQYRSKGWVVDEKPKSAPSRRKIKTDESE